VAGYLETVIIDRGSGMDLKKFKSGMFKPFVFAKPGSNQNETRGIGIGLNTATMLCDFLCGGLNLKSKKGKGTTTKF